MTQKTVFVGLSGGVDSSVAALRLIKAGYKVVGVFIKVWQPDFLNCNWEKERLDAMRVAAKLGIPFLTCDAEEAYRADVAEYFINEYKLGRTPNPDVMCNKYVKFGAFLNFAKSHGATLIATGHYAKRIDSQHTIELHRGEDIEKDQSYFLWTLNQEQLAATLLPVGNSAKTVIRQEASQAGLLTAEKKDSQGVCFLGHIDIPEFIGHYTKLTTGPVLNTHGEVIGEHQGALVYTTGQRHGFSVKTKSTTTEPHYVTARDISKNTITVDTLKPTIAASTELALTNCNWIPKMLSAGKKVELQTRYRQKPVEAVISTSSADSCTLSLLTQSEVPSSGQSCVLYEGSQCLGGGIIL